MQAAHQEEATPPDILPFNQTAAPGQSRLSLAERYVAALEGINVSLQDQASLHRLLVVTLQRLVDHVAPPQEDRPVGTDYVAGRLGLTATRVAQMASDGNIPPRCIVRGRGRGKPWKFYRDATDQWIESR